MLERSGAFQHYYPMGVYALVDLTVTYVLKLISKNAEAPPNGIRFSTRTKTKLKGTQTDFYIREGAFCRIAFLHSVGCRSPPFLPASFDLMVIEQ